MLTMTDFIMEQELSLAPEPKILEKTDEELAIEIVESFMNMSAAFSNLECILECVTIVDFCKENEIQIPKSASIVAESFLDKAKDVFASIYDWFRSIIASLCNIFTKDRCQKIIAKIKSYKMHGAVCMDPNTKEGQDLFGNIAGTGVFLETLYSWLFSFITVIRCLTAESSETAPVDAYSRFFNELKSNIKSLSSFNIVKLAIKTMSNSSDKDALEKIYEDFDKQTLSSLDIVKEIADKSNVELDKSNLTITNLGELASTAAINGSDMLRILLLHKTSFDDAAIAVFEFINKFDMPHRGSKLLKELDLDKSKMQELINKNIIDENIAMSIRACARGIAARYDSLTAQFTRISQFLLFTTKKNDPEAYKVAKNTAKSEKNTSKVSNEMPHLKQQAEPKPADESLGGSPTVDNSVKGKVDNSDVVDVDYTEINDDDLDI